MSSLAQFERDYVRPRAGRTLIVGSQVYSDKEDRRRRYRDVVGVDMLAGPGVDLVVDLEEPLPPDIGVFAHVECMSVLEHSRRPWLLAANLERLLAPGGTIFVSVPWIWRYHAYDHDYFRFSPDGLAAIFQGIEWTELMVASDELRRKPRVPALKVGGYPYLARAETVGFGRRP